MAAHADLIEPYILQNFSFDRLPSTVKQVRAVFFSLALEKKNCLQIASAPAPDRVTRTRYAQREQASEGRACGHSASPFALWYVLVRCSARWPALDPWLLEETASVTMANAKRLLCQNTKVESLPGRTWPGSPRVLGATQPFRSPLWAHRTCLGTAWYRTHKL
jgi:hypothetical protein